MLKQFKQLALATEGRYATATELQFIKDYLQSADTRISAYEKMRDREDEMLDMVQTHAVEEQKDIFMIGTQNRQNTARRDSQFILRHLGASMLAHDLERYRDGLLIWHRTIMNAQKLKYCSRGTRNSEYQILEQMLAEEEFKLAKPALMLGKTLLA